MPAITPKNVLGIEYVIIFGRMVFCAEWPGRQILSGKHISYRIPGNGLCWKVQWEQQCVARPAYISTYVLSKSSQNDPEIPPFRVRIRNRSKPGQTRLHILNARVNFGCTGTTPILEKNAPRMVGQNKKSFTRVPINSGNRSGSLLRELCCSYCSSRGMPF